MLGLEFKWDAEEIRSGYDCSGTMLAPLMLKRLEGMAKMSGQSSTYLSEAGKEVSVCSGGRARRSWLGTVG